MATFTIGKMIGVGILVFIVLAMALPMIQVAFMPPVLNTTVGNVTNATIPTCTANTSGVGGYNQTYCLLVDMFGTNASLGTNSRYGYIFNATQSLTVSNNTNSTGNGGFFANIFSFTGLSFVFPNIGNIILTIGQLGRVFGLLINGLFGFLPAAYSGVVSDTVKILVSYIYIRMILLGVSAWMKFSLLDG